MKQVYGIWLMATAILYAAACDKPDGPLEEQSDGPVQIIVEIDPEDGSKSTLSESGAFAFSNGDAIRVYQGSKVYEGTTASNSNSGAFTMDDGFSRTGDGLVGFPAHLVTSIDASNITFTLPASYTFSQVGSANPNTCKAPIPMVGKYTASNKVTLKQVGSVIRFRFNTSDIYIGNIDFVFPSNVTGEAPLVAVDPGSSAITEPSTGAGTRITVSISSAEWASISGSTYTYITLPVPTGLTINQTTSLVLVTYSSGGSSTKMGTVSSSTERVLARAQGFKSSVSVIATPSNVFQVGASTWVSLAPGNLMAKISDTYTGGATAEVSEWKFGGYFETIGDGALNGNYLFDKKNSGAAGKWIDLFCWQGTSSSVGYRAHGVVSADYSTAYFGNADPETTYDGCWNGLSITNGNTPTYTWRLMTNEEWEYLVYHRTGATVDDVAGKRYSRATVSGVNGLLLLPDGLIWKSSGSSDSRMDAISRPNDLNGEGAYTWGTCTYTTAQMSIFADNGIVFLPVGGYRDDFRSHAGIIGATFRGDYWTNSSSGESANGSYWTARRLAFRNDTFAIEGISSRGYGFSVRLARDVPNPSPTP